MKIELALIMFAGAFLQAVHLTMGYESGVVAGLGSLAAIVMAHSLILTNRVEKLSNAEGEGE